MPLANVLCSTDAVIYTRSVKSIELLINFAPFVIILCLWNIQRGRDSA